MAKNFPICHFLSRLIVVNKESSMGKIIKVLGIVVVFLLSLFSIYHIIQSRALDENAAD